MTDNQLALVQMLPLLYLPVNAYAAWLAWLGRGRASFAWLAAGVALSALICFGPFAGRTNLGHGGRWDAMAGLIYFGIVLAEAVSTAVLAAVLLLVRKRIARGPERKQASGSL